MVQERAHEKFQKAEETPLLRRIRELSDALYNDENGDRMLENYEKMRVFAEKLRSKYPDFNRRKVYHMMIGSSVESFYDIDDDFPGEDSVVGFLEKLTAER